MTETAWNTQDVADYLGYTSRTIARWRAAGEGPPWHRTPGGGIRYVPQEVRDWLAGKDGTSPAGKEH